MYFIKSVVTLTYSVGTISMSGECVARNYFLDIFRLQESFATKKMRPKIEINLFKTNHKNGASFIALQHVVFEKIVLHTFFGRRYDFID